MIYIMRIIHNLHDSHHIARQAAGRTNTMGHSREAKADSRERILAAASQQIREQGLDGIGVAEVMRSAGLTHGAFYAHFPSRAALLAEALERALRDGIDASDNATRRSSRPPLERLVRSYLSAAHRDAVGEGCAISALAGEAARAEDDVRNIMRDQVERLVDETAPMIGEGEVARQSAVAAWCTMVGAVTLSRLFKGQDEADGILVAAREAILANAASSST